MDRLASTKPTAGKRVIVSLALGLASSVLGAAQHAVMAPRLGADGDASEREGELLKKIGELTVERDSLANGLGRLR